MKKLLKILGAFLAIVLVVTLVLMMWLKISSGAVFLPELFLRKPLPEEGFYSNAAMYGQSTRPCYKISPKAYVGFGFNSPGFKVNYVRSGCFFDVALETKNPAPCSFVRPLTIYFFPYFGSPLGNVLDGSKINKKQCIARVQDGATAGLSFPSYDTLMRIFSQMGYTEHDMVAFLYPSHSLDAVSEAEFLMQFKKDNGLATLPTDFFIAAAGTKDFLDRLDTLPNF